MHLFAHMCACTCHPLRTSRPAKSPPGCQQIFAGALPKAVQAPYRRATATCSSQWSHVHGPQHFTCTGCTASCAKAAVCTIDVRVPLQEHVREETFDEAAKQEAEFFSYIATSYKHYLNGDDEECERVDGQQRQSFQDRAEAAQRQVQELDQVQQPPQRCIVQALAAHSSPAGPSSVSGLGT